MKPIPQMPEVRQVLQVPQVPQEEIIVGSWKGAFLLMIALIVVLTSIGSAQDDNQVTLTPDQSPLATRQQIKPRDTGDGGDALPVKSPSLTASTFKSYKIPSHRTQAAQVMLSIPICVLGHDNLSQKWLAERAQKLLEMQAVCFMVNADNASELATLRAIAPKTTIAAMDGEWLHRYFDLKHYPALITKDWIAQ